MTHHKHPRKRSSVNNWHLRCSKDTFIVTTGPTFIQLETIHDYLSQSIWVPDRC
ncbi:Uncharacterised protein [Escherichia coli]|nr:Uncharacterised protein [Escherichia coli]